MDEQREVKVHPLDYLMILRRRLRWFIFPALLVLVGGVALTFLWPAQYRSSVTIAIAGGAVTSDLSHPIDKEERVRAFSQQLLALPTLARLAKDEQMYPGTPDEAQLMMLRQNVQVGLADPVPGSDPGQVTGYVVSYSDANADHARQVAQRLADIFLEENAKSRQQRAELSSEFLAAQMRDSKNRLDLLQTKLSDQQKQNMGSLPEQSGANLQMVSGLQQQLANANTDLRGQQDRLTGLQREIQMFAAQQAATTTTSPDGTTALPSTPDGRVLALEQKLAELRLRYTENHPDVKDAEDQLRRAKIEAARVSSLPEATRNATLEQNPAYRQLVQDRDNTELRIRDIQRQMEQIGSQMHVYEARLNTAPSVEQQIAPLAREFELEKKNYEELSGKYRNAVLTEELERKRGTESFRLLYPATTPLEPYEPNRQRMLLMTLAASLFVGIGSAVGREYIDRSVHDARTLQKEFDVPVLAEIPHIHRVA